MAQDVWNRWQVKYRDVVVLDAFNRPIARDNLTSHDLGNPANFSALKTAILNLAVPADTDHDGLPDDWELAWFGSLDVQPDADGDGDGADNFAEFAFATSPIDKTSKPTLVPFINRPAGKPALATAFRRFTGGAVDFVVESSNDLVTWSSGTTNLFRSLALRNLYDGAGSGETRYQQTSTAGAQPFAFMRVRPVRKLSN